MDFEMLIEAKELDLMEFGMPTEAKIPIF